MEAVKAGAVAYATQAAQRDALHHQMAEVVFAYWAAKLSHPTALYDPKREKRLVARLVESDGDWGLLCYAVDGALRDDWIMGRDDRATRRYDGIETIFRDRGQVERLAEQCPGCRAGKLHPLVLKYHANGHHDSA